MRAGLAFHESDSEMHQKSPAQTKMRLRSSSSSNEGNKDGGNSAVKQRIQKRPPVKLRLEFVCV